MEDAGLLHHHKIYKLYKIRWFVLSTVVMFNLANAMVWITFAPVTNYVSAFFDITETTVNWFSLVFFIAFIPCCFASWWFMETYGLKTAIIIGSLVMFSGAYLRVLGVFLFEKPNIRFIITMIGQVLCATTQPLVLSMPTKVAALWFGDKERTIANTIASMSNPLGVLIANGVAVLLVKESRDVPYLVSIFSVPAYIGLVMAVIGVRSSSPPTPPSVSAEHEPESFFLGLKHVFRNRQFMLLCATIGFGIGLFSTISTILQQMICPQGYSNDIAGICGVMIIVGGFIGSFISGIYIDRTRAYILVAKVMVLLFGLSTVAVMVVSAIPNQTPLLVISFFFFGFFALGVLPVMLELGVECTYPVDEATSSGMQWMMGQIIGVFMMIGGLAFAPPLSLRQKLNSVCDIDHSSKLDPVDLTIPVLVMVSSGTIVVSLFVILFNTTYKRLNAENENA
ncbi:solute carrier family 49 member A3 isoform X1 [Hydra vulgaris]|uniref:solute carrier family 49 member A3 isoform X1 n=2 Tax=Hydra vulgaris TaxID=6087 RepID=UPI001F5FA88E|nr:solute carrier family 49 member A3 isoform X1 [Hydra vulgaris]